MVAGESQLSNDPCGRAYLIPYEEGRFIFAQVGLGGDLGVFEGLYDRQTDIEAIDPSLLFRVHYGRKSPRRFGWINLGVRPYRADLDRPRAYVHQAIGDSQSFLVTFGEQDRLVDIEEARSFEPLAAWSHEHIVERFRTESAARAGGARKAGPRSA